MKVWTGYKTRSDSIKLVRNQILAIVPRRIGAVSCSDQIWPCISYQLRRLCQRETGAEYRSHKLSAVSPGARPRWYEGRTSVVDPGADLRVGHAQRPGHSRRGISVATQRTPEGPGLGARRRT